MELHLHHRVPDGICFHSQQFNFSDIKSNRTIKLKEVSSYIIFSYNMKLNYKDHLLLMGIKK